MIPGRFYGVRWSTIVQRFVPVEVWRETFVGDAALAAFQIVLPLLYDTRSEAADEAERRNAMRALEQGP